MQKQRQPLPKRSRIPVISNTSQQANNNKQKQMFLRSKGINIKVDGSWGPWQEQQYRRLTQSKQASAGALAIPLTGYGIGQTVGATGASSVSLPAAIMTAPVALTMAGPIQGLQDMMQGTYRRTPISVQQRQEQIYSPQSTSVRRDLLTKMDAPDTSNNTSSTSSSTSSSSSPENPKEPWYKKFQNKFKRKNNNQNTKKPIGKTGVKWYLASWAAPAAVDVVGNMVGPFYTSDSTDYKFTFPILRNRAKLEKGLLKSIGNVYKTDPNKKDTVSNTNQVANPSQPAINKDTIKIDNSGSSDNNVDFWEEH